jgi:hypothetical protein
MLWNYPNFETQGGFIDSTSGTFTPDPESVMIWDSAKDLYRTPDEPYLFGPGGNDASDVLAAASYDLAQRRWLPVPRQHVSPDGSAYAYAVAQPGSAHGVHLVDVRTGTDKIVHGTVTIPNDQANYFVVGYLQNGVYLNRAGPGGPRTGLWRLEPASGSIIQVSTDAPFLGVFVGNTPLVNPPTSGNPDAWWSSVSGDFSASKDPYAYHQYLTGVAGQHAETWFQRPGFRINVIGVDSGGHAVVVASSPTEIELWLLATPDVSTRLSGIANDGSPDLPFKTAVDDPAGWWIGSRTGVFLATNGAFTQVSATPAVVVGGCT